MKFIQVTGGSYIAVDKIVSVYHSERYARTLINFIGDNNYVLVSETPEQIMQMIKDVTE